ncbi:hypothetical protein PV05_04636 [Exophiala xenobiotica]|uniref:BTB domain-containing protein n=1 Tax=Exophiala xenobiotica TaxID=348802 RepID=A0A0D2D0M0_9EURO|nr:uncharacterized protein PV05_04636 [Exophiala xenobiotica]KIW55927.1 hypothetical protein PV05_04636 [Exophiala xenobiotica]
MATDPGEIFLPFLENGKFSDFIIECQGVVFKVHRLVICTQSPMLAAACSGSFEEALSGRITFPEEDPEILARVILFMYSKYYHELKLPRFYHGLIKDDGEGEEDRFPSGRGFQEIDELGLRRGLKVNALVYKCAEMLGLDELKDEASARFMRDAKSAYDMDGFEDPLRLLYESTRADDTDLRFKVTCLCVENHDILELRKKTIEVIKEHEGNVWSVSGELLKRLANSSTSKGSSDKKLGVEQVVMLCNRRATKINCNHKVYVNTVRVAAAGPLHVVIKCPTCDLEDEG